jgi:deoxyribodipyrimidine photo-lyase
MAGRQETRSAAPVLLWLRQDLRLSDNPALLAAVATGAPIVPVFIWSPEEASPWEPGAASRWWLHHSLTSLSASFKALGAPLVIRRGPSVKALLALAKEAGAHAVYFHWTVEPELRRRDDQVTKALTEA